MNDFKKNVGKRIKEIRLAKNISQEVLAEKVGVETTTVSYWERGKNALTFGKIPLIAKALGIPVYKLFVFSDCETDADELKNLLNSLNPDELSIAKTIINLMYISK